MIQVYCKKHLEIHSDSEYCEAKPEDRILLESQTFEGAITECNVLNLDLHFRNARYIMSTYRRFLIERKNKENRDRISQGGVMSKRSVRGLVYYRAYLDAYRKAKRSVLNGEELVNT